MKSPFITNGERNLARLKAPKRGVTLAELKRKMSNKVSFIWRDRLPAKMLTLLSAREGVGKTTTALAIVKEVLEAHQEGYVIWIAAEGLVTTIQQASWLGLDNEDRFIIATNRENSFSFNFTQYSDLKRLQDILKDYEPVILVVIDCLSAVSPFDDKDQQTGKLLYKLNDICQKAGAACLVLHHDKKGQANSKLDQVSGNTQITRAPRLVLKLEAVKGSSLKRRIIQVKSNLMQTFKPIELVKTSRGLIFYEPTVEDEQTVRDRCEELLVELFSRNGGELPANFVYEQAEAHGISQETLHRVKKALNIASERVGKKWFWVWSIYKTSSVYNTKREVDDLDNLSGNPHGSKAREDCQEKIPRQGCQDCQDCLVGQDGQDCQDGLNEKGRQSSQNSRPSTISREDSQYSSTLLKKNSSPSLETKEEFVL